jgi:hypothetical protein
MTENVSVRQSKPSFRHIRILVVACLVTAVVAAASVRTVAAATTSITSGSVTPASTTPGRTIAITASFTLGEARSVATYFEIRNSANAIVGHISHDNQAFSAGQTRSYTWNYPVPSNWPPGTYRVHAGIFAADWSRNLLWVPGITSVAVGQAVTATPNGRQFYVDSVSGSDAATGTSPSAPWRSLGKVNASTFQPGDVINFKGGSVWTGNLQVKSRGTSTAAITYQAYGTGAAPQIKNPGVTWGHAVTVTGSYNVIQGFLFTDAQEAGVMIKPGAVRNVILKNEITRTGTGVTAAGESNLITGNYVHDLTMLVNDQAPDTDYGAVCFWVQANNNEISYNRGINCRAPSYDYGYDGGFVEVWQTGDNTYIHHNYAENTNGFFELGSNGTGSAQNIRVAYNVIINVAGGLCFHSGGSFNINMGTFRFENNTYVSNAGNPDGYRVFGCRSDFTFLQVRNNIFYSDIQIANNGNFTHTNNLYNMVNMVNGWGVGYSLGAQEQIADPVFVNLGARDLRLRAWSPAVDTGTNLGYTKDFGDMPVGQGVAPDKGAFEYQP